MKSIISSKFSFYCNETFNLLCQFSLALTILEFLIKLFMINF